MLDVMEVRVMRRVIVLVGWSVSILHDPGR